jgi:hypothetical protein
MTDRYERIRDAVRLNAPTPDAPEPIETEDSDDA